ncbi:MAG TPA: hypothetical protein VFW89_10155 [Gemmatimonadaceae bacterium]|nr:hypothetical protein [Gemmatimonadaceae bacterium]
MTQPDLAANASAADLSAIPAGARGMSDTGLARTGALARAVARSVEVAGLLAIFGISFEMTARLQDWVRFRMPILSTVTAEEDLMVRDASGAHGRPNAQYRKWIMDSLGLRGPDVPVTKPAGSVRVIVTGASETFGLYESPDQEYARQLEDTLNARLHAGACPGRTPVRFEVLNAAFAGMTLPTVSQDVRARLARLRPDIVVFYPSPAQYLDVRAPAAATPDSSGKSNELPRMNVLHPRSLDALRDEVKSLMPGPLLSWLRRRSVQATLRQHPAGWRYTSIPVTRLARFDGDLRDLVGTVRTIGAEPVLATHATAFSRPRADSAALIQAWERFAPRATGNVIIAFDDTARVTTMRAAADSNVLVSDVSMALARAPGDNFADFVHFTDHGAAIVANALAPTILQAAGRRAECGR